MTGQRVLAILIALTIFCLAMVIGLKSAGAHDWYTMRRDPVRNIGCCGGNDCGPIPLEADWVTPVHGGYRLKMTALQSQFINPSSTMPVDAFIPEARVQIPSVDLTHSPALYWACISRDDRTNPHGGVYCFFAIPSM